MKKSSVKKPARKASSKLRSVRVFITSDDEVVLDVTVKMKASLSKSFDDPKKSRKAMPYLAMWFQTMLQKDEPVEVAMGPEPSVN